MNSSHDIHDIAKQCENWLNTSRQGALTNIHLNDNAHLAPPLFDADRNIVNLPLLLSVFDQWQQQGKITRLIHFYRQADQHRLFHLLGSDLLMWTYDQEETKGKYFSPIWLSGWALLKINLHGSVTYDVGDELLDLNQAAAFMVYGQDEPINKNVYSNEPETGVSILFNPKWLNEKLGSQQSELMRFLRRDEDTKDSITQLFPVDGKLVDLVRQLLKLDPDDFLYLLEIETISTNILLQSIKMLREQSATTGSAHKFRNQDIDKLTNVKSLLESDYSHQFSLDYLSRHAGLNRRKLTEGFKGLFGSTVNEYLLRQRMINAADMLKQGVSATEVAHQVGYKEQSSFTRAFKRYYNILPRDFAT
ncbi:helix-turn-helix transcriptional regulator [Pseudomaricurvus alkylphenolicus]|uniref:helix-turn-helix transcriptional regulator n=1 Tax=Pseudomaricurvus alkylphenolicus TaxID=1306991 RepID=UPI00141E1322|nr:AraC family transcriptional regulator [Pseudomaricurvus alkylphenolicus]NIB45034.1 helix-turn-helix transcriptional regulator [Pseudomaricurvus alkylphenolicus]